MTELSIHHVVSVELTANETARDRYNDKQHKTSETNYGVMDLVIIDADGHNYTIDIFGENGTDIKVSGFHKTAKKV